LTSSILYQERRKAGHDLTDTGTRNTIDRLDLFCEWNLDRDPELVKMVGERYLTMYRNHVSPPQGNPSIKDLLKVLGDASRECGEAISVISQLMSANKCTPEVAQAIVKLELALATLIQMEKE
jgi:hypothetical protein